MSNVNDPFEAWYLIRFPQRTNSNTEQALKELFREGFNAGYLSATLSTAVDVTPDTPFNPLDHEQTR